MKYTYKLFILLFIAAGCQTTQEKNSIKNETPKPSIILMIGDGMGVAQVSAANYWSEGKSNFYRFPIVGLNETSSTSSKVTDSAAGATAFSTGVKTYNRAIGVSKDSISLPTILEELKAKGYQTGLISLTSITHATPAAFYAHVTDRDMHEEIADQLVSFEVDFFAGGGWQYFVNRKDNRNLLQELIEKGYMLDTTALTSSLEPDKKYGFFGAKKSIPSKVQGRGDFLREASALAIDHFKKSGKPYFLMIESSYIDWGGHAMDPEMMIQEAVDFDQTIGEVLNKIESDTNTVVIVTADHETGGASVGKYYEEDQNGDKIVVADTLAVRFITDQHTASLVPVFAKGYKEEVFSGVYANNQIYHKMKSICLPD